MLTTAEERLCHVRKQVQQRIGASRFRTWFGDNTGFRLHDDGLDVVVASAFAGTWIANNYMEELVAVAAECMGGERRPQVRIVQAHALERGNGAPASQAAEPTRSSPALKKFSTQTPVRGDLRSFVVGPSNRLAHAAALSIVQSVGRAFRLLVLHGGCGLGKTHLLQGICNGLSQEHPTVEWRYVSGEEFTNEYIFAVRSGPIDAFRAKYRKVDVLVVDDIHFLANKKATQEEFLHTFNAIDAAGKAVVVSTDRHPRSITTLSEPLQNRLISGMVVQIDPPDAATRTEILRRRALAMNLEVGDDVLTHISERICRNVRELEGSLFTVSALASLNGGRITLDLARRVLDESVVRTRRTPDVEDIVRVVSARFSVSREQIHSRTRDATVVLARSLSMLLTRRHTSLSFPEIGRALGKKNHSTVLMATQRVERLLHDDATVAWKSPVGTHEARLRGLLEALEADLFPSSQ